MKRLKELPKKYKKVLQIKSSKRKKKSMILKRLKKKNRKLT